MVKVVFDLYFRNNFKKIKSQTEKERILKQVKKIRENYEIGKPMKYRRKGTRELYIGSFRIAYSYIKNDDCIIFLELYHKNKQ